MSSAALSELAIGLAEVEALQRANPTPQQGGGFTKPAIVRALGRAEVVLLSSHFERYLYALNAEACGVVVDKAPPSSVLPTGFRLLHTRDAIDELAQTQWPNREAQLRVYSALEAGMWLDDEPVTTIESTRLLGWMKSPEVDSVVRLFRIWGIDNIFGTVTRLPTHQGRLRLRIGELVAKRNNIAHGDQTVEATYLDVRQYKAAVKLFCGRADGAMSRLLGHLLESERPW